MKEKEGKKRGRKELGGRKGKEGWKEGRREAGQAGCWGAELLPRAPCTGLAWRPSGLLTINRVWLPHLCEGQCWDKPSLARTPQGGSLRLYSSCVGASEVPQ